MIRRLNGKGKLSSIINAGKIGHLEEVKEKEEGEGKVKQKKEHPYFVLYRNCLKAD